MSAEEKKEQDILNMEEQIDSLGQEVLAEELDFMKRRLAGDVISEEEEKSHKIKKDVLAQLSESYGYLKKMGRVSGKSSKTPEQFGQGVMDKVRQKSSAMGSIVRTYNNGGQEEQNG